MTGLDNLVFRLKSHNMCRFNFESQNKTKKTQTNQIKINVSLV